MSLFSIGQKAKEEKGSYLFNIIIHIHWGAEVARSLGVTTSDVTKVISKGTKFTKHFS